MEFERETRKNFCINIYLGLILSVIIAVAASGSNCAAEDTQTQSNPIRSVPQTAYREELLIKADDIPTNAKEETEGIICELPKINTNVKFFTDYRCYDLWYTPHYRLQQKAWTDSNGLRRFNNDYIVAVGSFYSTAIGDRFRITLDSGNSFTVIVGDGKWDADCDELCMYTPCVDYNGGAAANLLEFIVDKEILSKAVYEYGSIEKIRGFEGNIVEMVYLGRDSTGDWDTYEVRENL